MYILAAQELVAELDSNGDCLVSLHEFQRWDGVLGGGLADRLFARGLERVFVDGDHDKDGLLMVHDVFFLCSIPGACILLLMICMYPPPHMTSMYPPDITFAHTRNAGA